MKPTQSPEEQLATAQARITVLEGELEAAKSAGAAPAAVSAAASTVATASAAVETAREVVAPPVPAASATSPAPATAAAPAVAAPVVTPPTPSEVASQLANVQASVTKMEQAMAKLSTDLHVRSTEAVPVATSGSPAPGGGGAAGAGGADDLHGLDLTRSAFEKELEGTDLAGQRVTAAK